MKSGAACNSPGVVGIARRARFLRRGQAMRDEKSPIGRNRNGAHAERIELDQRRAPRLRSQHRRVVHTPATSADELFAVGENCHQLLERAALLVGTQQRQRERNQQRGGRREPGCGWKVGLNFGIDATSRMPELARTLRRRTQVILPIAARRREQLRGPFELASTVIAAHRSNHAIIAHAVRDAHIPPYRNREHGKPMVVDVLADQIDPSRNRDHSDTIQSCCRSRDNSCNGTPESLSPGDDDWHGLRPDSLTGLLVLNKEGTLAIVDPSTRKVVWQTNTGEQPHEVTLSTDGMLAFTSNYGGGTPGNSISMINMDTQKEQRRIDLG